MTLQQKILSHFATYDNFNSDGVVENFGISGVLLNRNCI